MVMLTEDDIIQVAAMIALGEWTTYGDICTALYGNANGPLPFPPLPDLAPLLARCYDGTESRC